jgi:NADH dehydrogenase I D subunit
MEDKFGSTGVGGAGYVALGHDSGAKAPFGLHSPPGHYTVEHDSDDLWDDSRVIINLGPTHPAMHGSFRMVAKINGETIEKSYCEFGYTHRAKEKLGEHRTYHQYVVFTDRMNYCSALINNVTYAMSVERLMGIEVPPRCTWIRMMACEISRIIDHLICVGIGAVDVGAFSYFLYGFHQREEAYTLIEKLCGARLTTSYTRIGGLMYDAPEGWADDVRAWIKRTRKTLEEMDRLLTTNKIFCQRTQDVGKFSKEQAMEYSFSGPSARASGWDRDLRRDQPVMFYPQVEFDVVVGSHGDVHDRYLVRVEEMNQSLRILEQCCDRLEKGPIWTEDKRVRIPAKQEVYTSMEAMIHHFKFFMTGFDVPVGEAYTAYEAANGELGFYIVSKGKSMAHRMRVRGPSFWHYQALSPMAEGGKIADMIATLGSINIIAGELDR